MSLMEASSKSLIMDAASGDEKICKANMCSYKAVLHAAPLKRDARRLQDSANRRPNGSCRSSASTSLISETIKLLLSYALEDCIVD